MSIIYLLNTHNLLIKDDLIEEIDERRRNRILKTNNIEKKKELVGSYLLLKDILESNYHIDIKNIEYDYNEYNKPFFKNLDLFFSISHSQGIIVLAISKKEIGIDIEKVKELDKKIIKNILNEEELRIYNNLNNKEQLDYVYEVFCGKEAYVKKLGTSITIKPASINLDEVTISRKIFIGKDKFIISCCGFDDFRIIERFLDKQYMEEKE